MNFFQHGEVGMKKLPEKLGKRLMQFDPNERNGRGETLITATIKYVADRTTQVCILVEFSAQFSALHVRLKH